LFSIYLGIHYTGRAGNEAAKSKARGHQPVARRAVGAAAVYASEEEVAVGYVAHAVAAPLLRAASTNEPTQFTRSSEQNATPSKEQRSDAYHAVLEGGRGLATEQEAPEGGVVGDGAGEGGLGLEDPAEEVRIRGHGRRGG
jgi:hypothetical protein